MNKSANKMYKESGAKAPFKEWLKDQQKVGNLEQHEGYSNADGEDNISEEVETKVAETTKQEVKVFGLSTKTLVIGIGIIAVGYWYFNKSKN